MFLTPWQKYRWVLIRPNSQSFWMQLAKPVIHQVCSSYPSQISKPSSPPHPHIPQHTRTSNNCDVQYLLVIIVSESLLIGNLEICVSTNIHDSLANMSDIQRKGKIIVLVLKNTLTSEVEFPSWWCSSFVLLYRSISVFMLVIQQINHELEMEVLFLFHKWIIIWKT